MDKNLSLKFLYNASDCILKRLSKFGIILRMNTYNFELKSLIKRKEK